MRTQGHLLLHVVDKHEEKKFIVVNTFGKKGLGMLFDQF
jgi:hypothetical protein